MTEVERREKTIAFEMNYCQHYSRGKGADMACKAGMDLKTVQRVATEPNGVKWGPCIGGHNLPNPREYCPHWIRRTREQGEKRADVLAATLRRMEVVLPIVTEWRKKKPIGKAEIIECPECKGKLHLSQSSYNGHVHVKCETPNCVAWME